MQITLRGQRFKQEATSSEFLLTSLTVELFLHHLQGKCFGVKSLKCLPQ